MEERHDLWAVAGLLVGRFGPQAGAEAEANAAKAERDGDDDAHTIWTGTVNALDDQKEAGDREG